MFDSNQETSSSAQHRSGIAWPIALAIAAVGGTFTTSCAMPLVSIAVMSAATLQFRAALLTLTAAWAFNQLVGYCLLGFPFETQSMVWGVAAWVASVAALLVARVFLKPETFGLGRTAAVLVLAFGVYEALLFVLAAATGALATFTPAIVIALFANEAAWSAVLATIYLAATGVFPKVFGAIPNLRVI